MSSLITSIINTVPALIPSILKKTIKKYIPLLLSFLFACPLQADPRPTLSVVVITQIVEHVSLDQEREGLIGALAEAGYKDGETVTLIYQNAQGSMPTAVQIAASFAGKNPAVAVGISTPSAQTLIKPMANQQVPLVFTAVTDPIEANLISSLTQRPENVTGVSDALPIRPQLELIRQLVPGLKTLGVLYNPSESNSGKAVEQLQAEASIMGLTLELATAGTSSAVVPATLQLVAKQVDAIFIPNDNTAVAAMESIVSIGLKNKLPIFAGDAGSVTRGAIAAQAYNRETLGRKAGTLVVKILKGERPNNLVVETSHPLVLMINLKSANDMGVSIPDDLIKQAQIMGDRS